MRTIKEIAYNALEHWFTFNERMGSFRDMKLAKTENEWTYTSTLPVPARLV
jgi:hypothetical protein